MICIYALVGHKKYIQQWFEYIGKIKNLWLTKLQDFLTVTWCLKLQYLTSTIFNPYNNSIQVV